MKTKSLFVLALANGMTLVACGKNEEKPPEAKPPEVAVVQPEPDFTCQPMAKKRTLVAATAMIEATDENVSENLKNEAAAAAAARAQWKNKTFDDFKASVVKECGENGKFIVNGDVAFSDEKHLREFFEQVQEKLPPAAPTEITVDGRKIVVSALAIKATDGSAALTVNTLLGEETLWSSAQKKMLTYCVSSRFNSKHDAVVADMEAAAGAWEAVSDIDFQYVSAQDASCTAVNGAVVFDVRPVDVGGDYLARAFFPNEPRAARNVLIDLSALDIEAGSELTLEGVLRHELGHALGFRHEHTRPESGTCFEDGNWTPVTSYDKFSVMHYPQCNGGTSWALTLTPRDQSGAACVYGAKQGFPINTSFCTPRENVPIPTDAPTVVRHAAQTVANKKEVPYSNFLAKPGSIVKFTMTASGTNPGDPDLYVRFGNQNPRVSPPKYHCRPYLTGANEACELTVPSVNGGNRVRYMVHGYTAGAYELEVSFVPAN